MSTLWQNAGREHCVRSRLSSNPIQHPQFQITEAIREPNANHCAARFSRPQASFIDTITTVQVQVQENSLHLSWRPHVSQLRALQSEAPAGCRCRASASNCAHRCASYESHAHTRARSLTVGILVINFTSLDCKCTFGPTLARFGSRITGCG